MQRVFIIIYKAWPPMDSLTSIFHLPKKQTLDWSEDLHEKRLYCRSISFLSKYWQYNVTYFFVFCFFYCNSVSSGWEGWRSRGWPVADGNHTSQHPATDFTLGKSRQWIGSASCGTLHLDYQWNCHTNCHDICRGSVWRREPCGPSTTTKFKIVSSSSSVPSKRHSCWSSHQSFCWK